MLEEGGTILEEMKVDLKHVVRVIVPFFNGFSPQPVERSMPIVASFSWRLLYRFFLDKNCDLEFTEWFAVRLPRNGGQLMLASAVKVIERKLREKLQEPAATLYLFLGVDEYQKIEGVRAPQTGSKTSVLRELVETVTILLCTQSSSMIVLPMFAGTDLGVIEPGSIANSSYYVTERLPMNLLSMDQVFSIVESDASYAGLLNHAQICRHLFILGGVPRWTVEYLTAVNLTCVQEKPVSLDSINNCFETIWGKYVESYLNALESQKLVRLAAFAVSGRRVRGYDMFDGSLKWSRLRDSSLCLLIPFEYGACDVRVPYALLHSVGLSCDEKTTEADRDFAGALKDMREEVDSAMFKVQPWQSWEMFGACFYAVRINALLVLGHSTVTLGDLLPGTLMSAKTRAISVKLVPSRAERVRPPNVSGMGLRTCFASSTRWFMLVMFAAATFALVMAMVSSTRYEHLSSGLIWGGVLSAVSVSFVIISYVSVPAYRQHPNPLMFWRTIADAIFVCQLLAQQFVRCVFFDCGYLCNSSNLQCGCTTNAKAGETCIWFAGVFEFSLIAAECWFLSMTANLLLSLTNPFTDFKRNTKLFHVFSWGTGLLMAVLLMTINSLAGFSDLGVCWTNAFKNMKPDTLDTCDAGFYIYDNFNSSNYNAVNANIASWVFFYVWMAFFIVFGIGVWVWAWKRLSEGMPETYAVRVQSINRARFNVFAVTIYWILVAIIYFLFLRSRQNGVNDRRLNELLNFVIAGKGYVDLVIWFSLNDFRVEDFKCMSTTITDVDVDLNPQVNAALRREVLFYTTSGIVQAVQSAERLPASQRIQHLALLPQSKANPGVVQAEEAPAFDENQRVGKHQERSKTFHDYEPHAFKKIRERFGVDND
ncbi:hypothetical protein BBO99_00009522 [Phytophthora kernoviae]|uniref:G-protein coupled receptors family 2 profile 2 domain-containing protein n=1 Tax=Phytophthora kernoviae TaxID=325452 RepID=A0A3R7HR02_9STRA|nr:hypothetical protein BBO99_00009522 [Phytophthora kernoviae]